MTKKIGRSSSIKKKSKKGVVGNKNNNSPPATKVAKAKAEKVKKAAARKAAQAKKVAVRKAAQAKKAAVQEAAQAEKRMKDGRAARPGSRAHTRFLEEYYKPEVVKAREEKAAAWRQARGK
jgi:hypothetical protein